MRNLHLILVLATSLLPFATVQAAPADLPETGQTICYNAAGAVIACAGRVKVESGVRPPASMS